MKRKRDDTAQLPKFSLRALLIGVLIAAIVTAWTTAHFHKIHTEKRLRSTLVELGATISLTDEESGWITGIHFSSPTSLNDKHLQELAKLQHLRVLSLDQSRVTGDGLKVLPKFPALRELHVGENQLSGNGVSYLKRLDRLERLTFWGTPFNDPRPNDILQSLANVRRE